MSKATLEALKKIKNTTPSKNLFVLWSKKPSEWVVFDSSLTTKNLTVKEAYLHNIKMRRWCRENCNSEYSILHGSFAFSDPKEAFRFKLQFGYHLQ